MNILVVGDSLAVGLRPSLPQMLDEDHIAWRVKSGMGSPWVISQLRAGIRDDRPDVILISSGTNDGPDPERFEWRIRKIMQSSGQACVLWYTIARPARKGAYRQLNQQLRKAAENSDNLHLLQWERAVRLKQVALPDGVHPTSRGYRKRASMAATGIRNHCSP